MCCVDAIAVVGEKKEEKKEPCADVWKGIKAMGEREGGFSAGRGQDRTERDMAGIME